MKRRVDYSNEPFFANVGRAPRDPRVAGKDWYNWISDSLTKTAPEENAFLRFARVMMTAAYYDHLEGANNYQKLGRADIDKYIDVIHAVMMANGLNRVTAEVDALHGKKKELPKWAQTLLENCYKELPRGGRAPTPSHEITEQMLRLRLAGDSVDNRKNFIQSREDAIKEKAKCWGVKEETLRNHVNGKHGATRRLDEQNEFPEKH